MKISAKYGLVAVFAVLVTTIPLIAFMLLSQQNGGPSHDEDWLDGKIDEIYDAGFSVKYSDWVIWNTEPHFLSSELTSWYSFFNSLKDSSIDPRRGRQCIWHVYIDKNNRIMWYELHDYVTYFYY